jgi:cytochrome o ubiquinol oxidase subunit 2
LKAIAFSRLPTSAPALRAIGALALLAMLSACHAVVLSPAGEIAERQRNLLLASTALMLLVIVPVMLLTALFAWRYRSSNRTALYRPEWDHSMYLELLIWAAPLLIIICLGALTWVGTHLLDPSRPLSRPSTARTAPTEPLRVDVVALDWKWLFIYPQYGIAAVNELAAPVDQPIQFYITSSTVMNSFYVPALAGQIYAMPGMRSELNAVINKPGDYAAFSANYSGAGFSGMHFVFHGLSTQDFKRWIARAGDSANTLDRSTYLRLMQPSQNEPVHLYASVDPQLFDAILDQCVAVGTRCRSITAAIDRGAKLCATPSTASDATAAAPYRTDLTSSRNGN